MRVRGLGAAGVIAAAGVGGVLAYTVARVQGRAAGDVSPYLSGSPARERPVVDRVRGR